MGSRTLFITEPNFAFAASWNDKDGGEDSGDDGDEGVGSDNSDCAEDWEIGLTETLDTGGWDTAHHEVFDT